MFCRLFLIAALTAISAFADLYNVANFSGHLSGGSANVKSPFSNVISQGGPVTGSFVYDAALVPSGSSGLQNVFFSSFPDVANIPNGTAFTLNLGSPALTFDLGSAMVQAPTQEAAVQYNNGQFNGFFFVSQFNFEGSPYELDVQGRSFDVFVVVNGTKTFTGKVHGTLDIGDANLTDVRLLLRARPFPNPAQSYSWVRCSPV